MKEILSFSRGISQWISTAFSEIFSTISIGFSGLKRKKNYRCLKLAFQTRIQLCVKVRKFGGNGHFRSGVIFTPEVRMEHVDRHWKAYPAGNKGESPEFECRAKKC